MRTAHTTWGLVTVTALVAAALLSGCSFGQPSITHSHAALGEPQDPLNEITDSRSSRFISANVHPLLHKSGKGSESFTIKEPSVDVKQVQFFVSCSPSSDFRVTMGGFYSGPCGKSFQNSGTIPIASRSGGLRVSLKLPTGVEYWIVALPVEHQ